MQRGWIIGIDEVGRGALAGPVVVAAALLPRGVSFRNRRLGRLKDSKKLAPARRAEWLSYFLRHPRCAFALARVYPRQIEKRNISNAANVAALRACAKLCRANGIDLSSASVKVFLDGGLFLGSRPAAKNVKTIVKGDETINAVKAASIAAKVHRDRLMVRLGRRYPAYAFAVHKGYATRSHRAALRKYGPSPAHRLTFMKNFFIMDTYGRSTSQTSQQRKDGAAPLAPRHEKTAPLRV